MKINKIRQKQDKLKPKIGSRKIYLDFNTFDVFVE